MKLPLPGPLPIVVLLSAGVCAAAPTQETYRIAASDGVALDQFANNLDVDGGLAIVAARGRDGSAPSEGTAYVFDWATGAELYQLLPSQPTGSGSFGQGLSIDGTTAVIGAPSDAAVIFAGGKAYQYDLTTGAELRVMAPAVQTSAQNFGYSVDIEGGLALIGAPGDRTRMGAGYLFDLASGAELAKWVPSNAAPNGSDGYGFKVALDGAFGILSRPGSVAVYDVASGTQLYLLQRPGTFGVDIDADGGVLVVGAYRDSQLGPGAGAAYVFDLATGAELAKLTAYDGQPGDELGVKVAISSSHIVLGARYADVNGDRSGSAYVYDRGSLEQVARLLPSDGEASDWFGRAVAIDGAAPFIGAMGDAGLRGSAYRFDVASLAPGSPSCFGQACPCGTGDPDGGCPNATGSGAVLAGSGSASVTDDDLVLTTTRLPSNQFGLHFMGDQHAPSVPLGDGLLCASGALFRYGVQSTTAGSVALGPGVVAQAHGTFPAAGHIHAGASWTFQFWHRDSGNPCSGTSNTSSALTVLFTP